MPIYPYGNPNQHYSKEEARVIFHRAVKDGGFVFTTHSRERMQEGGLDTNDILHLAKVGRVINEPEPHNKTGQMTYRIEMADPPMKAVFTILATNKVLLITVITD